MAIYARYSTDLQNPNSVKDQIASCRALAQAKGWRVVAEYADEAMSGSRSDRPDFMRLSADLSNGRFDLVVAESLDRISRSMKDTAEFYAIATFNDIGIHTVDAGEIDKLRIAITSTMAEMFIDNLRVKTHRGLAARVSGGGSGGGRAYGYTKAVLQGEDGPVRGLVIVPEEAEVILRIFHAYAEGQSPMKIAAALNRDGIPAPRARSGSGHWMQNTINGHVRRGTGILNNELYIGRRVWNRLEYRRDPATSKRVSRLRPEKDWVCQEIPGLRIVPQELWDAMKARQLAMTKAIARAEGPERQGLGARGAAKRRKYLLSGLLHCGGCGGALIVAGSGNSKGYYCANAKQKGPAVCPGMPGLRKAAVEDIVLDGLREALMSREAVAQFRKDYARHLAEQNRGASQRISRRAAAVRSLEQKRQGFREAIGAGYANPSIFEWLTDTEQQLAALRAEAEADAGSVIQLPEDLTALYRAYVEDLAQTLSGSDVVGRASDELHRLIARITVTWNTEEARHDLDLQGDLVALLSAADNKKAASYEAAGSSLRLVAGARIGHCSVMSRAFNLPYPARTARSA
ncbi:recombinase family protein [Paracoccus aestuarii]|uniref:recombinase family protein n=1 Tax=Paracoccus aestuarii TaxID=453842 RepID=UPI001472C783|nr:recombinase family protein [Paracoccus aestuarii]WCQ98572.1 recombinase family protein [Paracoccus aestuarii]